MPGGQHGKRGLTMSIDEHRSNALAPAGRRRELVAFCILAIVIWPFVAVAVVGGYGFLVWMYQIVTGPPGPPPSLH
jgi:nitrate reductase NapE